jgi:hypothetical protein
MKSMRRLLKCDGLLPEKMIREGQFEEVRARIQQGLPRIL